MRVPAPRFAAGALALCAATACVRREEPPGAGARAEPSAAVVTASTGAPIEAADAATPPGARPPPDVLGTVRDNLPFDPDGTRLASIAWRNWVYTDVGPQRGRYGYLPRGQIVDVRGPPIVNDGCQAAGIASIRAASSAWARARRGARRARRGGFERPAPARAGPAVHVRDGWRREPLLYFRLPTHEEIKKVEGDYKTRAAQWKISLKTNGLSAVVGEPGTPPDFLSGGRALEKPYGVNQRLHFSVHSGRAAQGSGFALARVFEHADRVWGMTTELDLIALDRVKVVRPSSFHGVELGPDEGLPVAFIQPHFAQKYKLTEQGQLSASGSYSHREGSAHGQDAGPVPRGARRLLDGGRDRPHPAPARLVSELRDGHPQWIDISIGQQSLVAYVGNKPVYATLVSTGRGGMGDPEKVHATVRGTFMVYSKHVSATMDGEEDKRQLCPARRAHGAVLPQGYALHGTYWHDEFGEVRSHGCVNLAPIDAAWLFEWTDPPVPAEWHGVLNKERGRSSSCERDERQVLFVGRSSGRARLHVLAAARCPCLALELAAPTPRARCNAQTTTARCRALRARPPRLAALWVLAGHQHPRLLWQCASQSCVACGFALEPRGTRRGRAPAKAGSSGESASLSSSHSYSGAKDQQALLHREAASRGTMMRWRAASWVCCYSQVSRVR